MFGVYKLKRKLLPFLLLFALIVAIVPTSAVLASESGSAQIGDISYASLQEAFNAVPEDGVQTTVTLTNSIEISETVSYTHLDVYKRQSRRYSSLS